MSALPDPIAAVRSTLLALVCDPDDPVQIGAACVRPLHLAPAPSPDSTQEASDVPCILHIAEALAQGVALFEELSPPQVALLKAINRGTVPVFVPAGTLVRGGGQNRIVSVSTLLMAGEERPIEVRCVEAHRWNPHQEKEFRTSSTAPMSLKSRKLHRDSSARFMGLMRAEDQGETWREVTSHLVAERVSSRTESLFDAVDRAAPAAAPVPERVAGAAGAWLEGETTSGEVFPVKSLQRSGVKGLTDSARFESRTGDSQKRVSFDEARTDLLESGRFKTTEVRGGVIVDFAGARSGVVGSAFVADGRVLHVSFAAA